MALVITIGKILQFLNLLLLFLKKFPDIHVFSLPVSINASVCIPRILIIIQGAPSRPSVFQH